VANPGMTEEKMREAVEAVREHGSINKAAHAMGLARSTVQDRVRAAARKGIAPGHFEHGTAPGYLMGKVTVQRRGDGTVERVWERQHPEAGQIRAAVADALEGFKGEVERAAPIPAPVATLDDLCNLYTFTDYHLGMLAWHREGGEDWDLAIAEQTLNKAMAAMVRQSPKAHTAIINVQGDFLHTDGKLPLTPASKHVLDADTRFPKLRKAAIRLIRGMIAEALASHAQVHVIIAEGNHDEESAGWLTDAMAVFYENEPRLSVNDSQLPFYVFEWGETMIGVHHGHKVKNEALPLLFAAQFPEAWGRTKRREIHCGHRHHRDEKEYNGVTVVQHPTLAARDAYAARGGWIADRAAWAITYHKRFGAVGRVAITPEMLA
jgi:transposase